MCVCCVYLCVVVVECVLNFNLIFVNVCCFMNVCVVCCCVVECVCGELC